jgi:DNA-binding transcriptional regulator YhcF (GntR family)
VDEEDSRLKGFTPPYRHIADVLRGEILDGHPPVGERIPSQVELEKRFAVSRPTVQRALRELRKGGYIDNQRGRPSEVLPWRERTGTTREQYDEPEAAHTALGTHIAEAFEAPRVVIDVFSLTTETFNSALSVPTQRIRSGELNPESISVRVMLPSPDAHLAIPRTVADPEDDRPLRRLRQLVRGHAIAVRSSLTALSEVREDIAVSVEFRTVPITPLQKLYLINEHTALSGYYAVIEREVLFGSGERDEIYDVLGLAAVLFPFRGDPSAPDSRDSRFVTESQSWFDSLWSTIAEPLTLFE